MKLVRDGLNLRDRVCSRWNCWGMEQLEYECGHTYRRGPAGSHRMLDSARGGTIAGRHQSDQHTIIGERVLVYLRVMTSTTPYIRSSSRPKNNRRLFVPRRSLRQTITRTVS